MEDFTPHLNPLPQGERKQRGGKVLHGTKGFFADRQIRGIDSDAKERRSVEWQT